MFNVGIVTNEWDSRATSLIGKLERALKLSNPEIICIQYYLWKAIPLSFDDVFEILVIVSVNKYFK